MRISACMMVKNEQERLPRCLASLLKIADEIVVVDTGSTDASPDIAARFGAAVFHRIWQDDFSIHRNQSLNYATGDWLLVIDADEELDLQIPVTALKRRLEDIDKVNAVAVGIIDIRDGAVVSRQISPRIFRRGTVKYEGCVHNQPVIVGEDMFLFRDVSIKHFGFQGARANQKIHDRLHLYYKRLEGGDWPHGHFYLAEALSSVGREKAALVQCEKYISLKDSLGEDFHGTVFRLAATIARYLSYDAVCLEMILAGLKSCPGDPDLAMELADYGARKEDWVRTFEGSRMHIEACKAYTRDPSIAGNRFVFTVNDHCYALSLYRMAMCGLRTGADAWKRFFPMLPELPAEMAADIKIEARRNFQEMGLGELEKGAKCLTV